MQPFLDWIDTQGFHIAQNWDAVKGWVGAGKLSLFPIQRRVLGHCLTPKPNSSAFPYTTVIFSAPKKSGKTTIAAAVGAWYADEAVPGSEVYVLANDIEQAQVRVYNDISFHLEKSGFTPHKYFMEFPNGTVVRAIAQEYRSAAGGRQGLTLWDELWGYITEKSRRLWAEMTPPPTVPYPLRFIVTYAGFEEESELLWDLYKKVVIDGEPVPELADIVDGKGRPVCWRSKDGGVFAYWDTEPRMPWQTPEYYAEQMGTLRAPEFLRLHKNTWVTSQESFLPIELWDKAVTRGEEAGLTEPLLWKNHPFRNYPIYTAVDIGTKHDASAVVGCYYDFARGRVGVAHHKIWLPEGGDIEGLDLEDTVESYLEQVCLRTLPNAKVIVCDPTQFHRSKITLQKKGLTVIELPQSSTIMVNATENLYDIMRNGVLEAYSASDLRDHLKYAIVEHTGRGYRLAKEKHAKYKIDGAVALAWAAYQAVSTGGVDNRNPIVIRARDSDFTMMKPKHLDDPMAQWLPDAFKTEPTWRQLK